MPCAIHWVQSTKSACRTRLHCHTSLYRILNWSNDNNNQCWVEPNKAFPEFFAIYLAVFIHSMDGRWMPGSRLWCFCYCYSCRLGFSSILFCVFVVRIGNCALGHWCADAIIFSFLLASQFAHIHAFTYTRTFKHIADSKHSRSHTHTTHIHSRAKIVCKSIKKPTTNSRNDDIWASSRTNIWRCCCLFTTQQKWFESSDWRNLARASFYCSYGITSSVVADIGMRACV